MYLQILEQILISLAPQVNYVLPVIQYHHLLGEEQGEGGI